MSTVDYRAINLDPSKPYEEYSWQERRAHLLERISELGTPSAVSRTRQAEQFDVTPGQISQDIDALGEYVSEELGEGVDLQTKAVFDAAIRGLLEAGADGEWRAYDAAIERQLEWQEWLGQEPAREEAEAATEQGPPPMPEENKQHFEELIAGAEEAGGGAGEGAEQELDARAASGMVINEVIDSMGVAKPSTIVESQSDVELPDGNRDSNE